MKPIYTSNLQNPIAEARFKSGYSLERLGKHISLSKQYISRAEQGTYSGLNPALVNFAKNVLEISQGQVMARYMHFQSSKRKEVVRNVNPMLLARRGSKLPGNKIFEEWRSLYWTSSHNFATSFCIHPESVKNYEEGFISAIPEQLFRALTATKLIDPNWTEKPLGSSLRPRMGA